MKPANEFQGVCPVCYKPIAKYDDTRTLETEGRKETYHAPCVHKFFSEHRNVDTFIGRSLLEENKHLFINDNLERRFKRAGWVQQNMPLWQGTGTILKEQRVSFGLTLKLVASCMGISPARLKRFENGFPVRDATLLLQCYTSLMSLYDLDQRYGQLVQYLRDLEKEDELNNQFETDVI